MNTENEKGKTTLVLTYYGVEGYRRGVYQGKGGQVAIICEEWGWCYCWWGDTAQDLDEALSELTPQVSLEEVGKIYLYVDCHTNHLLPLAAELKAKGKDLELVCDYCCRNEKETAAQKMGVPLSWTHRGDRTLSELVDKLLGRPKIGERW